MKYIAFLFFVTLFMNCSEPEGIPSLVLLKSITISNIPTHNADGEEWDENSGPDLEFTLGYIKGVTPMVGSYKNNIIDNYDFGTELEYEINLTFEYGDLLILTLLDIDEDDENDIIVNNTKSVSWEKGDNERIIIDDTEFHFEYKLKYN